MNYHNPYHFVPVKNGSRVGDVSRADFEAGRTSHLTHDRHVGGTHSGRILCRLTTVSPIVVGAKRTAAATDGTAPAVVEPFEIDGQPAIPASSLRGLIASLAEAASNSALRVLEDKPYSFRKRMDESLSAIGMIVDIGGGQLQLRPLTLPMMAVGTVSASLPSEYDGVFPNPNLKIYVGCRRGATSTAPDNVLSSAFKYRTYLPAAPKYYGLKLKPRVWSTGSTVARDPEMKIKNQVLLLGQSPLGDPAALPEPWISISEEQKDPTGFGAPGMYTRGIIRVLGCWGRDDIPRGKKHEVFVPYPVAAESWPTLTIEPRAIERFEDLADQRTETKPELPYEPRDTPRGGKDDRFRIKPGDLVYFRCQIAGGKSVVSEIALSAIWRGRVEDVRGGRATAHSFFMGVDPELVPFSQSRNVVTPAEQVFGFVEAGQTRDKRRQALALASRVRFSNALPQSSGGNEGGSHYLSPVTLKILASPKPPCPALYFKRANGQGGYIPKSGLKPGTHHPQGRKFYLHHHHVGQGAAPPWKTANDVPHSLDSRLDQKSRVTPAKARTVFHFHVDFENLTSLELGMLCYSLKPQPDFLHKIGMGKAIGLGSIRIDPIGMFRVDRIRRYGLSGWLGPRYAGAWADPVVPSTGWPQSYEAERVAAALPGDPAWDFEGFKAAFADAMPADIKAALKLLGNPAALQNGATVGTPLVSEAEGLDESETFRWFVANDRRHNHKYLEPLPPQHNPQRLPTLPALPWDGD